MICGEVAPPLETSTGNQTSRLGEANSVLVNLDHFCSFYSSGGEVKNLLTVKQRTQKRSPPRLCAAGMIIGSIQAHLDTPNHFSFP